MLIKWKNFPRLNCAEEIVDEIELMKGCLAYAAVVGVVVDIVVAISVLFSLKQDPQHLVNFHYYLEKDKKQVTRTIQKYLNHL